MTRYLLKGARGYFANIPDQEWTPDANAAFKWVDYLAVVEARQRWFKNNAEPLTVVVRPA
jgi:hypothetical protein